MNDFIENPEPFWTPVASVERQENGILVRFNNERSGGFGYVIPWSANITIEGIASHCYRTADGVVNAMRDRFAKLTFDDQQRVVAADFRREIPS